MPKFGIKSITGVIPAMVTPFDENEKLDEARLRAVVRFLIERKLEGLYITGSTGESFLMSPEERKRVVEITVDEVKGRIPIIAHIGAISTHHSIDLRSTRRRPASTRSRRAADLLEFLAGPDLRLLCRHHGVHRAADDRLQCADGGAGLRHHQAHLGDQGRGRRQIYGTDPCRDHAHQGRDRPGLRHLFGADEMAMSGLAFGADGIIGSFYNSMPEIWFGIRDAVAAGNLAEAKRLQEIGNAVIFFSLSRGGVATIKRAMAWLGCDAGYVRRPLGSVIDKAAEDKLKGEFKALRDERKLKGVAFLDAL